MLSSCLKCNMLENADWPPAEVVDCAVPWLVRQETGRGHTGGMREAVRNGDVIGGEGIERAV